MKTIWYYVNKSINTQFIISEDYLHRLMNHKRVLSSNKLFLKDHLQLMSQDVNLLRMKISVNNAKITTQESDKKLLKNHIEKKNGS